ncbi:MAG TPA: VWA domain-containing protein [Acidobacteriota bacterium]|nr:VWA domain-containing protein [Acidobacteriota bacterium]
MTQGVLIPTDLLVFNRQGDFIRGLKQEQFELLVEGNATPITLFEEVIAGSPEEEVSWAKIQGTEGSQLPAVRGNPDDGRTLFFFLDDLHMSPGSMKRVRDAISHFIEAGMNSHDRILLAAATRQIGFMQQLSSDKSVLRADLESLSAARVSVEDNRKPPMSEEQALAIVQDDPEVLGSFVNLILAQNHQSGKTARAKAEIAVKTRAAALATQSVSVTARMLTVLADLLRFCGRFPGRKLVFFLSDGFVLNGGRADATDGLLQIAAAAQRAGIAIYTLDTGGVEASAGKVIGSVTPSATGTRADEVRMPPDGTRVLAAATGGRFLQATDALDGLFTKAIAETSRYYLLGWQVVPVMLQSGNSKALSVAIRDHTDYVVRLRSTSIDLSRYYQPDSFPLKLTVFDELLKVLRSPQSLATLPVSLYAGHTYQREGSPVLHILMQVVPETIVGTVPSPEKKSVDVVGVTLDAKGHTADLFQTSIPVPRYSESALKEKRTDLMRSRSVAVTPGTYQVRIAARDPESGHMGSAFGSIEVPPFVVGKLSLSSIFLRERPLTKPVETKPAMDSGQENPPTASRLFSSNSQLAFSMFIYNPVVPPDGSLPRIAARARILQGDRTMVQSPLHSVGVQPSAGSEPIAFEAGIALKGLAAGAYTLEIAITDQSNNENATQSVLFWIR